MSLKSFTNLKLVAPLYVVISLAAGLFAAAELNAFLDIRFESKELPEVPDYAAVESNRQAPTAVLPPHLSQAHTPLPLRMVDEGAAGILPDWGNGSKDYSLNASGFERVMLSHPPYVDAEAFAELERGFREYVLRMRRYGYNGIVLPGFLQFIDFAYLGGEGVYSKNEWYLEQHVARRQNLGRLYTFAKEQGMKVFLSTDMVALTPPLKAYFLRRFGKIDVSRREMWDTYGLALEELFVRLPAVDGLMIRIGEAGGTYNLPDSDYSSELLVKDAQSLRLMLTELLPVFERFGKTLIFRSWSVGVGKIGDMHTDPKTYLAALDGISSEALVVSTKYCMGDFDSFLPLNPTLMTGPQKRIIEFQSRREFEGFDAFPNYMAPLYQSALLKLLKRNERIDGAWVWTQEGGPLRASPVSLYLFQGFWQMVDANVYATARILDLPNSDIISITRDWARETYGPDQVLNDTVTRLLLESHSIVEQGLYIRPFAEKRVLALGLEPPSMLWIFKWNIVDGSSSALSAIYFTCRSDEQFATAVADGDLASARVRQWKERLAALEDRVPYENRADFTKLLESLDYEADLFETLSRYRKAFLYFYRWLDRGNADDYAAWRTAHAQFEQSRSRHESIYGKNPDFPAYNFFSAEAGLLPARRTPAIVRLSRVTLLICLAAILAGTRALNPHLPEGPLKRALNGLRCGLFFPWRGPQLESDKNAALLLLVIIFGTSLLAAALFTSFAAPRFLAGFFGLIISFALAFKFALNGIGFDFGGKGIYGQRQAGRDALVVPALAPLFAPALLFLAVLSVRGPLYFWYEFWTWAGFRTIFTVIYVFGLLWLLFAAGSCGVRAASAGVRLTRAFAATAAGLGGTLVCLGLLLGLPGLEKSLTALNDEMAVLPLGLSRILGITTHLNIPLSLPLWIVVSGAAMMVPAAVLIVLNLEGRYRR